jgi:hypothetical protein
MPWVVVVSAVIALPLSWMLAPRLRLRYANRAAVRAASSGALADRGEGRV